MHENDQPPSAAASQAASRTGAATRRRYTRAQKARAVGLALVDGTMKASEKMDIPATTISAWRHDPAFETLTAELRTKTREAVADEIWAAIQVGIREVAKGIVGDAPLRDKATALGILYDKHALLTGAATSRSENRDITASLSDVDLLAALHEAQRIASGAGTPETVEVPAEG